MKQLAIFLVLANIIFQAQAQIQYSLTFKDGKEDVLTLYNDLTDFSGTIISLDVFKFNIHEQGASGPFVLGGDFKKLLKNKSGILGFQGCFWPVDSRKDNNRDRSKYMFNADANYTHNLFSQLKTRRRKLRYAMQTTMLRSSIYATKIPINIEVLYGIRGGVNYYQNTILGETYDLGDKRRLHTNSVSNIGLYLGLSRFRYTQLKYDSKAFDTSKKRASFNGYVNFDLLFSPYNSVQGVKYGMGLDEYGVSAKSEGIDIDYRSIGFRLQGGFLSDMLNKKLGSKYGYEISYMPGIEGNNLNVMLVYGLMLGKF